jgi:hypothetical protein
MLLDRVVDFPRRSVQLLESYLKNLDEDTGKAIEAKNLGIPIMTVELFKNKYL